MIRVLTAAPAELLKLQAIRSCLLVLGRYVVAALAIAALQYNVIAWHKSPIGPNSPIRLMGPMGPMGLMRPIQLLPTQYLRLPCGRLHESRSADLSPSQSAQSTRSPSARCRPASPFPLPAAGALPR